MKLKFPGLIIVLLTFLISSCELGLGDIEVHNAWVRPTAEGGNAAVYFLIHNHSRKYDELTGASAIITNNVEIHQTSIQNDIATMDMTSVVPLPPGEDIFFEPGGLHVMMVGINQDLIKGERVALILHFKDHGDIVVAVQISDTLPSGDEGDDHDH